MLTSKKVKSIVGATTILVQAGMEEDDVILIVDVTSDRKKVVVTSPLHREEGTPSSARTFAARLRTRYGDKVSDFCDAIERAASSCIIEEERPS